MNDPLRLMGLYVRYAADRLELRDWQFAVQPEDLEGTLATVRVTSRRRLAVIGLSDAFFEADDADQRHAVVHELIHCHLEGARDAAATLERPLGASAYEMFRDTQDNEIESAAHALARAIAPVLLTPGEWAESRLKRNDGIPQPTRRGGGSVRAPGRCHPVRAAKPK